MNLICPNCGSTRIDTGGRCLTCLAMDYIMTELPWVDHFPRQTKERIYCVCQAVKTGQPMPFTNVEEVKPLFDV